MSKRAEAVLVWSGRLLVGTAVLFLGWQYRTDRTESREERVLMRVEISQIKEDVAFIRGRLEPALWSMKQVMPGLPTVQ